MGVKDRLFIGVTGHRNIIDEDKPELARRISAFIRGVKSSAKETVMLNSLAQGADMLCADIAFNLNIPVFAVLPCEEERYALSFDPGEREKFPKYLERAQRVIVSHDSEGSFNKMNADGENISRESYEYRQAGFYLAEHSDILIALWDGKPPKTKYGCGTAEVVEYALKGKKTQVFQVKTRRQGDGDKADIKIIPLFRG